MIDWSTHRGSLTFCALMTGATAVFVLPILLSPAQRAEEHAPVTLASEPVPARSGNPFIYVPRPDPSGLEPRVAELEAQIEAMAIGTAVPASPPVTADGAPQAPGGPDLTLEERQEAAQKRDAARREALEAAFEAEAPNPEWSEGAEASLKATLGEIAIPGTEVLDLECRASQCRMELIHPDMDGLDAFIHTLPASVPQFSRISFQMPNAQEEDPYQIVFLRQS